MRDRTHNEHIEKWAHYVRSSSGWKSIHTLFINAQFKKAYAFIERLSKTKLTSEAGTLPEPVNS